MEPLETERKTVHAMINIYCRAHHQRDPLCASCTELQSYVDERLEKCPFGPEKPTCRNCPVHCYQPEMRARIKNVMRFAGPRMFFHRPLLALQHLLKGTKS